MPLAADRVAFVRPIGQHQAIRRKIAAMATQLQAALGGVHRGREAMMTDGWWAFGRAFKVRVEPSDWITCADGRLLVLGRYVGSRGPRARRSTPPTPTCGAPVPAASARCGT